MLQCVGQLNDNNVQLVVPGHSNIQGNEKADQLARHGASQSFIGPEPVFGVPLSSVKEALKNEWLVIAIRDHWNRTPGHSYAKLSLPINSKQRAEQLLKLIKKNVRILTGLLTRHANLNSHFFRIRRSNEKICRLCREEDETTEHLLCECMTLETRRYKFMSA